MVAKARLAENRRSSRQPGQGLAFAQIVPLRSLSLWHWHALKKKEDSPDGLIYIMGAGVVLLLFWDSHAQPYLARRLALACKHVGGCHGRAGHLCPGGVGFACLAPATQPRPANPDSAGGGATALLRRTDLAATGAPAVVASPGTPRRSSHLRQLWHGDTGQGLDY